MLKDQWNNAHFIMTAEAKTLGTANGAGLVGETTRMSCNYQGKPIPDIRWLRQGKVIETDDIKYIVSVDNSSEKEVTSYLEIIGYVIWITLVNSPRYNIQNINKVMNIKTFDIISDYPTLIMGRTYVTERTSTMRM